MPVLAEAQVGNGEGDDARDDEPQVAVGSYAGDLPDDTKQGDVLSECKLIKLILVNKHVVPLIILMPHIVGAECQHRQ